MYINKPATNQYKLILKKHFYLNYFKVSFAFKEDGSSRVRIWYSVCSQSELNYMPHSGTQGGTQEGSHQLTYWCQTRVWDKNMIKLYQTADICQFLSHTYILFNY